MLFIPFEPAPPPAPSLSTLVSYSSKALLPLIRSHPPSSSPLYPSNSSSSSSHAHSRNPAAPNRRFAHNMSQSSRPCPMRNQRQCYSQLKERTRFLAHRSRSRRRCGSRRSCHHRSSQGCRNRSLGTAGQSNRHWRSSRMGTAKVVSFPSLFFCVCGSWWAELGRELACARRWVTNVQSLHTTLPHFPQFFGSLRRSKHLVIHSVLQVYCSSTRSSVHVVHGLSGLGQKHATEIGPASVGGRAASAWNMWVAQIPTAREIFMIVDV